MIGHGAYTPILGDFMALGPLPAVANVIRLRFNGLNQTTPWVALFHWHYNGVPPTAAALGSFCTAAAGVWSSTMPQAFATTVSQTSVDAIDLSSAAGAAASGGTTQAGARTGTALPASVAACVGWKVNYRWRGGHFRTYWPMGVVADLQNGHLWVETSRAIFEAANEGFLSQMNALQLGGTGGHLTGVRYVHTVTDPDGTKHQEYFTPPLDLQISRALVDARLDTQRRRLGPDL